MNKKTIGLTYGDPSGIGPEILSRALQNWSYNLKPLIIGSKILLTNKITNSKNNIGFYEVDSSKIPHIPGKPSKYTGMHSYLCLKKAVLLAKKKKIIAIVTGPVSKFAINKAGIPFKGQTEEIAKLSNIDESKVIMLFVAHDFRIALYTRHIPLSSVSKKIKKSEFIKFILLLDKEFKKWFSENPYKKPKIAVLGLNPHASEGSLFGNEEKNIILPAVNFLKRKGVDISGPYSPDATLAKAGQNYLSGKKQEHDLYVSFYHDQCLPVFKAVAGFDGVNVTLGLPFLRVSVDHGTAFDIAGKKKASNKGLISAIKLLETLLR